MWLGGKHLTPRYLAFWCYKSGTDGNTGFLSTHTQWQSAIWYPVWFETMSDMCCFVWLRCTHRPFLYCQSKHFETSRTNSEYVYLKKYRVWGIVLFFLVNIDWLLYCQVTRERNVLQFLQESIFFSKIPEFTFQPASHDKVCSNVCVKELRGDSFRYWKELTRMFIIKPKQ